jgi:hypothetical protein
MNSSRSCPVGLKNRPFLSQVEALDKFPVSYSKQSSSIDKKNGVGLSSYLFELISGAVS